MTEKSHKTFALIDGKSIFYRGYYAMPALSTQDGTPTGGVYGFTSMALELMSKIKPDYVAVAWDKPKTNIRRRLEIYPEYKAGRKPAPPDFYAQIPILRELLGAFGWPLYELDDYEADDIMGTLSEQANAQGVHTIMVSSDLDMLQLIDHDTELYALKKGLSNLEKFDMKAFHDKYGLLPNQFLDLKSLKGDGSDNIPGVPGIGEKTAVALLQEFYTLDEVYDNLSEIKPAWRAKLMAGKDSAYMSKELGRIWTDAPIKLDLKAVDVHKLNVEKLRAKLQDLEFTSLLRRLPDFMRDSKPLEPEIEDQPGIFFTLPDGKIVVNDGKVLCEKILRGEVKFDAASQVKPSDSGQQALGFDDSKVVHNGEIVLPEIAFDTRIASFLLGRVEKVETIDQLKKTYETLKKKLSELPKLERVAKQLDFPTQILLAKIEQRGVKIDVPFLNKMSQDLAVKIRKFEQEIWDMVGYEFNVSSAPQLSDALFKKLMLPTTGIKKSVRGYFATNKSELEKLRGQHPIIEKITEVREVLKMKNTYTDALPNLVAPDGKLHTDFRQDVTATGRLSSSNPNLQNIPIRTELGQKIRRAFVASPGKVLVSGDYSQFELRLAAALANDEKLIKIFADDKVDVHTLTAAEAFDVPPEKVTPTQRRAAKVINFGVLYGMSPHGLAVATGMSYIEARDFIEKYFAARAPIRKYLDDAVEKAKTDGYVETLFGRRRLTPDVHAANFVVREAAKRAAANMPLQGTEADLMKMAMLKIEKEVKNAAQILQIHDSILVECDPEDVKKVGQEMKQIMENIYPPLKVRLKVDIKSGKNWSEL
ncbi:DNA polymerase [Candidatus Saccharibacteria bacterium]|nr:DNA polymerase [Candidatus Saccharibacteria bacterium]